MKKLLLLPLLVAVACELPRFDFQSDDQEAAPVVADTVPAVPNPPQPSDPEPAPADTVVVTPAPAPPAPAPVVVEPACVPSLEVNGQTIEIIKNPSGALLTDKVPFSRTITVTVTPCETDDRTAQRIGRSLSVGRAVGADQFDVTVRKLGGVSRRTNRFCHSGMKLSVRAISETGDPKVDKMDGCRFQAFIRPNTGALVVVFAIRGGASPQDAEVRITYAARSTHGNLRYVAVTRAGEVTWEQLRLRPVDRGFVNRML